MPKSLFKEISSQLFSIPKEMGRQITGHKPRHYHRPTKRDKQIAELLYKMKLNGKELKNQTEIMKHKAKSKGWI